MTIDLAAGRYFSEVGKDHVAKDTTLRDLTRLVEYFGKDKLLTDIKNEDVNSLVSWRRGQKVARHRKKARPLQDDPLVSNATVNRSTTEVLKKLFTRARKNWGVRFDIEPDWKAHRLREPVERIRELNGDEGDWIFKACRPDYRPFLAYAENTGARLRECFLQWSEVNWEAKKIQKKGKGGNYVFVDITPVIRRILWPLRGHHSTAVFTYVARRNRNGNVKGERVPITYNGMKIEWKRLCKRAKVLNFRFHDFRHNAATKFLRKNRNPKDLQHLLNHKDVQTSYRYAHTHNEDVVKTLKSIQIYRTIPAEPPKRRAKYLKGKVNG